MSPQTYKRRLVQLYSDMHELYEAGKRNPALQVSLMHLCRAKAVVQGKTLKRLQENRFSWGSRQYVARLQDLLKERRHPATLTQLLKELQGTHPELVDVQYRTFHPAIREELAKSNRRLAECGKKEGRKLYGLPHWQSAKRYTPGVKNK